jgi:acetyltransferase-like isoleucine patch superfamily enzyme
VIPTDGVTIGRGCIVDPVAQFRPTDLQGANREVIIGDGCRINAGAIIHGGTRLLDGAVVEEGAIVGKPEWGYALGRYYDGVGASTTIGAGAILRAGSCVYAGSRIGNESAVGHNTVIRSEVVLGDHVQLAHMVSVERACQIGNYVRCSPLTHLTSHVVAEDRVFIGAGVVTINDKGMVWKEESGEEPVLEPPYFAYGCRIGSGSVIGAGIRVGRESLIGSGSVVTRDIPDGVVAYGSPAKVISRRAGR